MKDFSKKILSALLACAVIFGSAAAGVPELDFSSVFAPKVSAAGVDDLTYEINDDNTVTITRCKYYASGELIIPEKIKGKPVTVIGNGAFEGCTSLTGIIIPDSVILIGEEAFKGCKSLASVKLPDNVTRIGDLAFYNTGYYSDKNNWENGVLYIGHHLVNTKRNVVSGEYTVKDGTKTIANSAFYECTSLTSINIPNSITSISKGAFSGCKSLASINIPDSVTSIGYWAFVFCTSLKDVYYSGSETDWEAIDIDIDIDSGNACLKQANIHFGRKASFDKLGDVDGDRNITAADARLALRAAVGLEKLTNIQTKAADADKDGKITAADARKILRAAVGLDKLGGRKQA